MSDFQKLKSQLRELSHVTPNSEMTGRVIAATRAALFEASSNDQSPSWSYILHPTKAAVAAAVILVTASLIAFSLLGGSSNTVAYAEVVAQIERVKTIQYLETRTGKSPDGKLRSPTEVTKVTVLGRYRQRREVVSVTEGGPLTDGSEWLMPVVGTVSISDLARGKYVGLNLQTKTFHETKRFSSISPDDRTVTTSEAKPAPEVDLYNRIRAFAAEGADHLAARKINGKKVVGFRTVETVRRKQGVDTLTLTYWIDPSTRLPVQIEGSSRSTNPFRGQSDWVLSDIVFDEPIDEALLSTDQPEGYKVLGEEGDH